MELAQAIGSEQKRVSVQFYHLFKSNTQFIHSIIHAHNHLQWTKQKNKQTTELGGYVLS